MVRHYKELKVYQEAYKLALIVSKESLKFPRYEHFDLGSQLRRATRSIPSNIAEGWSKRQFPKLFKLHLLDAIGSCDEVRVHLEFARDLDHWNKEFCEEMIQRFSVLGKQMYLLLKNWKSS